MDLLSLGKKPVSATQPLGVDARLRPFYWRKPMPKPPRKLGKLHFAYYPME